MTDVAHGRKLGYEIQKALGLEGHRIRNLTIRCPIDGAATAEYEEFIGDDVVPAFRKYVLVGETTAYGDVNREYRKPA